MFQFTLKWSELKLFISFLVFLKNFWRRNEKISHLRIVLVR